MEHGRWHLPELFPIRETEARTGILLRDMSYVAGVVIAWYRTDSGMSKLDEGVDDWQRLVAAGGGQATRRWGEAEIKLWAR